MEQIPLHRQIFRLVHHLSTRRVELQLLRTEEELIGRARRLERRRRKTQMLMESIGRRLQESRK